MFGSTRILNRIAQTITVGDVFAPFIGTYSSSASGTEVREDWDGKIGKETPLDHIGLVAKDGVPVGTIGYEDLEENRSIWASMNKLSWTSVVAADTPLIEAAKFFNEKSPFVFLVLRRNELVGWMSYYHLLGIPFRACLFSMLLAIEQAMLEITLTNPSLALTTLGEKKVKSLERQIKKSNPKQPKVSPRQLLDRTLFSDKLKIIKGCAKTSASIPALSDSLLNDVEAVRNSLAHASEDFRLIKLLSKERLHVFLTWLTKLETELRTYIAHGQLAD